MKKLLILLLLLPHMAASQGWLDVASDMKHKNKKLSKINFKRDTICYKDRCVTLQRAQDGELYAYTGTNSYKGAMGIKGYQDALWSARANVKEERKVEGIEKAAKELRIIQTENPSFDVSIYDAELNFYRWFNVMMDEKAVSDKRKKDSTVAAQKLAYEIEQAERRIRDSIDRAVKREQRRIEDSVYNVQAEKERKLYLQGLTKKYGAKNAQLIADNRVVIGFTKAMCLEAWGEPSRKSALQAGSLIEMWWYGANYLEFKNGKLIGYSADQ